MKAYRYNAKKREDRLFNTTGREKNPLKLAFYANSLENAERYKNIYDESGDVAYECELQVDEVSSNLFDMENNFEQLNSFRYFIQKDIDTMAMDFEKFLSEAKTAKQKKMWKKNIENLKFRKSELIQQLKMQNFQQLTDFEMQCKTVAEIKMLGFDGYKTSKEVVIF